jgi:hypothetical protein
MLLLEAHAVQPLLHLVMQSLLVATDLMAIIMEHTEQRQRVLGLAVSRVLQQLQD